MGNEGTRVPTQPCYLNPPERTMACAPTFTFCLKVIRRTLRRTVHESPVQDRDLGRRRNLHNPRADYFTPDLTIYQRLRAARLDPRIDRGNNDRMERTMGARVETPFASRQATPSRLGCVTSDLSTPSTGHWNRYT